MFPMPRSTLFCRPALTSNIAIRGAAKDANLRVIFIDRVTINLPDGKPVGKTGSNRLVYLVAPVKNPAGANVQLVVGGLTDDPADVPGPFGGYLLATIQKMHRSTSSGAVRFCVRRIGYLPRQPGSISRCTSSTRGASGIEPRRPM